MTTILTEYHRRLSELDGTRQRMEALYSRRKVRHRDILAIYEALFLRAVVGFEQFLEILFLEIVNGRIVYPRKAGVQSTIGGVSAAAVGRIVFQHESYLNWLPYKLTEKRAKLYLKDGMPFVFKDDHGERSKLSTIMAIRNAIAHSSAHLRQQFKTNVIGSRTLLPMEKTPAGFLRSQVSPGTRQFEVYLGDLGVISAKIFGTPKK